MSNGDGTEGLPPNPWESGSGSPGLPPNPWESGSGPTEPTEPTGTTEASRTSAPAPVYEPRPFSLYTEADLSGQSREDVRQIITTLRDMSPEDYELGEPGRLLSELSLPVLAVLSEEASSDLTGNNAVIPWWKRRDPIQQDVEVGLAVEESSPEGTFFEWTESEAERRGLDRPSRSIAYYTGEPSMEDVEAGRARIVSTDMEEQYEALSGAEISAGLEWVSDEVRRDTLRPRFSEQQITIDSDAGLRYQAQVDDLLRPILQIHEEAVNRFGSLLSRYFDGEGDPQTEEEQRQALRSILAEGTNEEKDFIFGIIDVIGPLEEAVRGHEQNSRHNFELMRALGNTASVFDWSDRVGEMTQSIQERAQRQTGIPAGGWGSQEDFLIAGRENLARRGLSLFKGMLIERGEPADDVGDIRLPSAVLSAPEVYDDLQQYNQAVASAELGAEGRRSRTFSHDGESYTLPPDYIAEDLRIAEWLAGERDIETFWNQTGEFIGNVVYGVASGLAGVPTVTSTENEEDPTLEGFYAPPWTSARGIIEDALGEPLVTTTRRRTATLDLETLRQDPDAYEEVLAEAARTRSPQEIDRIIRYRRAAGVLHAFENMVEARDVPLEESGLVRGDDLEHILAGHSDMFGISEGEPIVRELWHTADAFTRTARAWAEEVVFWQDVQAYARNRQLEQHQAIAEHSGNSLQEVVTLSLVREIGSGEAAFDYDATYNAIFEHQRNLIAHYFGFSGPSAADPYYNAFQAITRDDTTRSLLTSGWQPPEWATDGEAASDLQLFFQRGDTVRRTGTPPDHPISQATRLDEYITELARERATQIIQQDLAPSGLIFVERVSEEERARRATESFFGPFLYQMFATPSNQTIIRAGQDDLHVPAEYFHEWNMGDYVMQVFNGFNAYAGAAGIELYRNNVFDNMSAFVVDDRGDFNWGLLTGTAERTHPVQEGDTLGSIAAEYFGSPNTLGALRWMYSIAAQEGLSWETMAELRGISPQDHDIDVLSVRITSEDVWTQAGIALTGQGRAEPEIDDRVQGLTGGQHLWYEMGRRRDQLATDQLLELAEYGADHGALDWAGLSQEAQLQILSAPAILAGVSLDVIGPEPLTSTLMVGGASLKGFRAVQDAWQTRNLSRSLLSATEEGMTYDQLVRRLGEIAPGADFYYQLRVASAMGVDENITSIIRRINNELETERTTLQRLREEVETATIEAERRTAEARILQTEERIAELEVQGAYSIRQALRSQLQALGKRGIENAITRYRNEMQAAEELANARRTAETELNSYRESNDYKRLQEESDRINESLQNARENQQRANVAYTEARSNRTQEFDRLGVRVRELEEQQRAVVRETRAALEQVEADHIRTLDGINRRYDERIAQMRESWVESSPSGNIRISPQRKRRLEALEGRRQADLNTELELHRTRTNTRDSTSLVSRIREDGARSRSTIVDELRDLRRQRSSLRGGPRSTRKRPPPNREHAALLDEELRALEALETARRANRSAAEARATFVRGGDWIRNLRRDSRLANNLERATKAVSIAEGRAFSRLAAFAPGIRMGVLNKKAALESLEEAMNTLRAEEVAASEAYATADRAYRARVASRGQGRAGRVAADAAADRLIKLIDEEAGSVAAIGRLEDQLEVWRTVALAVEKELRVGNSVLGTFRSNSSRFVDLLAEGTVSVDVKTGQRVVDPQALRTSLDEMFTPEAVAHFLSEEATLSAPLQRVFQSPGNVTLAAGEVTEIQILQEALLRAREATHPQANAIATVRAIALAKGDLDMLRVAMSASSPIRRAGNYFLGITGLSPTWWHYIYNAHLRATNPIKSKLGYSSEQIYEVLKSADYRAALLTEDMALIDRAAHGGHGLGGLRHTFIERRNSTLRVENSEQAIKLYYRFVDGDVTRVSLGTGPTRNQIDIVADLEAKIAAKQQERAEILQRLEQEERVADVSLRYDQLDVEAQLIVDAQTELRALQTDLNNVNRRINDLQSDIVVEASRYERQAVAEQQALDRIPSRERELQERFVNHFRRAERAFEMGDTSVYRTQMIESAEASGLFVPERMRELRDAPHLDLLAEEIDRIRSQFRKIELRNSRPDSLRSQAEFLRTGITNADHPHHATWSILSRRKQEAEQGISIVNGRITDAEARVALLEARHLPADFASRVVDRIELRRAQDELDRLEEQLTVLRRDLDGLETARAEAESLLQTRASEAVGNVRSAEEAYDNALLEVQRAELGGVAEELTAAQGLLADARKTLELRQTELRTYAVQDVTPVDPPTGPIPITQVDEVSTIDGVKYESRQVESTRLADDYTPEQIAEFDLAYADVRPYRVNVNDLPEWSGLGAGPTADPWSRGKLDNARQFIEERTGVRPPSGPEPISGPRPDTITPPIIGASDDGLLGFLDGRHRALALREMGKTEIVVDLTPEAARRLSQGGGRWQGTARDAVSPNRTETNPLVRQLVSTEQQRALLLERQRSVAEQITEQAAIVQRENIAQRQSAGSVGASRYERLAWKERALRGDIDRLSERLRQSNVPPSLEQVNRYLERSPEYQAFADRTKHVLEARTQYEGSLERVLIGIGELEVRELVLANTVEAGRARVSALLDAAFPKIPPQGLSAQQRYRRARAYVDLRNEPAWRRASEIAAEQSDRVHTFMRYVDDLLEREQLVQRAEAQFVQAREALDLRRDRLLRGEDILPSDFWGKPVEILNKKNVPIRISGRTTVSNIGQNVPWDDAIHQWLATDLATSASGARLLDSRIAASQGTRNPLTALKLSGVSDSFVGLSRMWVPQGTNLTDTMIRELLTGARDIIVRGNASTFEEFAAAMDVTTRRVLSGKSTRRGDVTRNQRALKPTLEEEHSVAMGAYNVMRASMIRQVQDDLVRLMGGVLTEKQATNVNRLLGAEDGIRSIDPGDWAETVEGLNRLGAPITETYVRPAAGTGLGEKTARLVASGRYGDLQTGQTIYLREDLVDAIDSIFGESIKRADRFYRANPTSLGEHSSRTLNNVYNAWKQSVTAGYILPDPGYWTNNLVGDFAQMWFSVGLGTALKVSFNNLPNNVPVLGRHYADYVSSMSHWTTGKPALGTMVNAVLNPHLTKVWNRSNGAAYFRGGQTVTYENLYRWAAEDGILDTFIQEEFLQLLDRTTSGKVGDTFNSLIVMKDHWQQDLLGFADFVQKRQRLGLYTELLSQGYTRAEARRLTMEALYDWRHSLSQFEAVFVVKLSTFWRYWRNALAQVGTVFTKPITQPGETFSRTFGRQAGTTPGHRMRQAYLAKEEAPGIFRTEEEEGDVQVSQGMTDTMLASRYFIPTYLADYLFFASRALSWAEAQWFGTPQPAPFGLQEPGTNIEDGEEVPVGIAPRLSDFPHPDSPHRDPLYSATHRYTVGPRPGTIESMNLYMTMFSWLFLVHAEAEHYGNPEWGGESPLAPDWSSRFLLQPALSMAAPHIGLLVEAVAEGLNQDVPFSSMQQYRYRGHTASVTPGEALILAQFPWMDFVEHQQTDPGAEGELPERQREGRYRVGDDASSRAMLWVLRNAPGLMQVPTLINATYYNNPDWQNSVLSGFATAAAQAGALPWRHVFTDPRYAISRKQSSVARRLEETLSGIEGRYTTISEEFRSEAREDAIEEAEQIREMRATQGDASPESQIVDPSDIDLGDEPVEEQPVDTETNNDVDVWSIDLGTD